MFFVLLLFLLQLLLNPFPTEQYQLLPLQHLWQYPLKYSHQRHEVQVHRLSHLLCDQHHIPLYVMLKLSALFDLVLFLQKYLQKLLYEQEQCYSYDELPLQLQSRYFLIQFFVRRVLQHVCYLL